MDNEVVDNLYSAIKDYHSKHKLEEIEISWFGGEPMLFFKKIIVIINKINEFCKINNIKFHHTMTTNGYLLSEDNVKALLDLSISGFQITIDGNEETHNKYRKTLNNKGSWTTIINNLKNMKNLKREFYINIRINYNYEILDSILDFLKLFKEIFENDTRFMITLKAISKWGGENDSIVEVIPTEYNDYIHMGILNEIKKIGINIDNLYRFNFASELCYANFMNNFIIYKNGSIGKCTMYVNGCNEEIEDTGINSVIGDISKGVFDIDETQLNNWCTISDEMLENKGCHECIAFPVCLGTSCTLARIKYNEPICPPIKKYINDLILMESEGI